MNPARVNLLVPVSEQRAAFEPGDQVRVVRSARDMTDEELDGYERGWWFGGMDRFVGTEGRVIDTSPRGQIKVLFGGEHLAGEHLEWWVPRNCLELV